MSSTNKTTHYNLNQYVASDKPTYLVDYNGDMSAIDSAIYSAKSEADTNTSSIGTLSSLTTTVKTDLVSAINEVDSDLGTLSETVSGHTTDIATNTSAIGTLANLTTTNKTSLVGAVNEVNYNVGNFNLSSFESISTCKLYNGSGTEVTGTVGVNMNVAKNSDGSLAKIYGEIGITNVQDIRKATIETSLRPETDLTINGGLMRVFSNGNTVVNVDMVSLTIKTDGTVEIPVTYAAYANDNCKLLFVNSLLFIKDFGDSPLPQ